LKLAIIRYHHFLELVLEPDLERLSPTPDIDLVWHTHQIKGVDYRAQTRLLLGVVLDHIDAGEDVFVQSFDATAAKWKKKWADPYQNPFRNEQCAHCGGIGCPHCKPIGCVKSTTQRLVPREILLDA